MDTLKFPAIHELGSIERLRVNGKILIPHITYFQMFTGRQSDKWPGYTYRTYFMHIKHSLQQ